jgi:hypothetical protein
MRVILSECPILSLIYTPGREGFVEAGVKSIALRRTWRRARVARMPFDCSSRTPRGRHMSTTDRIERHIRLRHPRSSSRTGTLLTVVESGCDRIPLARRAKAFRENEEGGRGQMTAIEEHLTRSA